MKTILRTAVITFMASLLTDSGGFGGYPQVAMAIKIKSALEQKQQQNQKVSGSVNTDSAGLTDLSLVQTELMSRQQLQAKTGSQVKSQQKTQSTSTSQTSTEAKWGFLKNIVNIDVFFSSGAQKHLGKNNQEFSQTENGQNANEMNLVQKKNSQAQQKQKNQKSGKKINGKQNIRSKNKKNNDAEATRLSQVNSKQKAKLKQESETDNNQDQNTEEQAAAIVQNEDEKKQETQEEQTQATDDSEQKDSKLAQNNKKEVQPEAAQETDAAQSSPEADMVAALQSTQQIDPAQAQLIIAAAQAIGKSESGGQSAEQSKAMAEMAQQLLASLKLGEATKTLSPSEQKEAKKKEKDAQQAKLIKEQEKDVQELMADETRFKTKEEKEKHAQEVREEGLKVLQQKQDRTQEIDLEIEDPGAANKVAEEGAQTIQNEEEFNRLSKQLKEARKKPENKLGKGGFAIALKNPKSFENSMTVVTLESMDKENSIKVERFDTKDNAQTKTASLAMATTLQTEQGATIVDDQPGKESIIQNFNTDTSKMLSQVSSGYSIRHNLVQKMAPGDRSFHMVSWDDSKKFNPMKTFPSRAEADKAYSELKGVPKILVSGETGDVVLSEGKQVQVDQCLGMFYTQRYQGKYFGQP